MTSTTSPERIRLTITVTPEVHETFQKLAEASNVSLGRAMGDWLGDTSEAAQMMASLMAEARSKPKEVIRQLQGLSLGMVDATEEVLAGLRTGKSLGTAARESTTFERLERDMAARAARAGGSPRTAPAAPSPRLVIRGGKSPNAGKGKRS